MRGHPPFSKPAAPPTILNLEELIKVFKENGDTIIALIIQNDVYQGVATVWDEWIHDKRLRAQLLRILADYEDRQAEIEEKKKIQ